MCGGDFRGSNFVGGKRLSNIQQTLVDKDIEQRLTNQTNRVAEGKIKTNYSGGSKDTSGQSE